jgi:hypothetical protein
MEIPVQNGRTVLRRSCLKLSWVGGEKEGVSLPRLLGSGALVWALFSVVQVLLNGVVLDEGVVPAQIITGTVHYPAGHPHQVYYTSAFSLLNYLGAGLWALLPNAFVLSAIRNTLALFLSTFVPYTLVVLLTGYPLWGHLASALTLSEAVLHFQGVYPLMIFPHFYSTGHTGLHLAILTMILLTAGLWRTGGFILGLLPSIHLTMALVVLPWSICYLFLDREARAHRKQWIVFLGFGLAICACLAVFIRLSHPPGGWIDPAYRDSANTDLIYSEYERTSDFHRQPFPYHTMYPMSVSPMFAYLINPLAFFTMGILLLRAAKDRVTNAQGSVPSLVKPGNCFWVLLLVGIAWLYICTAWLVQLSLGSLPRFVQILMPGRFSNFSAALLIPLTVAAFVCVLEACPKVVQVLAIAMSACLVMILAMPSFIRGEQIARVPLFVLWGMLAAATWCAPTLARSYRYGAIIIALIVSGILLVAHPHDHDAVKIFAPFLISWSMFWIGARVLEGATLEWPVWRSRARVILLLACVIYCAAALCAHRGNKGRYPWEVVSEYDQEMNQWLRVHAKPNEMILAHFDTPSELQAKTGHPALMEGDSLLLMTYMHSLAPTLNTLMRDLFGIDYTRSGELKGISVEMKRDIYEIAANIWERRNIEEWQELGRKYGFRLVLSLTRNRLDLPPVVSGPAWTLYVIPPKTGQ